MTPELQTAIRRVYASVDAAVSFEGPRCDASGRCCRFKEYQHTLFLSHFEAEILLATAPPYEKPVSPDGCPFQVDNLCTARDERPLGCRIYFCDPAYQERQNEITETALAELKKIADDHGTGWRYAPLHVFLNDAERPAVSLPPPTRISLPLGS